MSAAIEDLPRIELRCPKYNKLLGVIWAQDLEATAFLAEFACRECRSRIPADRRPARVLHLFKPDGTLDFTYEQPPITEDSGAS